LSPLGAPCVINALQVLERDFLPTCNGSIPFHHASRTVVNLTVVWSDFPISWYRVTMLHSSLPAVHENIRVYLYQMNTSFVYHVNYNYEIGEVLGRRPVGSRILCTLYSGCTRLSTRQPCCVKLFNNFIQHWLYWW